MTKLNIHTILAPSNLGLRPLKPGHVPGTWRAPEALLKSGLREAVPSVLETVMERPVYTSAAVQGSRLLNSVEMRAFNLKLADIVENTMRDDYFSLVIGGDCSLLLGCLAGVRRFGRCILLHVDGHSDFRHPGNYNPDETLGAVAGMDLALATGRGEAIMTEWPGIDGPLVQDNQVVQLGERESQDIDWAWPDICNTNIKLIDVFEANRIGPIDSFKEISSVFDKQPAAPLWIHFDVDAIDQTLMPAVDSPGSPGLEPDFIVAILQSVLQRYNCAGISVTVFDPDKDSTGECASLIVSILARAFSQSSEHTLVAPLY